MRRNSFPANSLSNSPEKGESLVVSASNGGEQSAAGSAPLSPTNAATLVLEDGALFTLYGRRKMPAGMQARTMSAPLTAAQLAASASAACSPAFVCPPQFSLGRRNVCLFADIPPSTPSAIRFFFSAVHSKQHVALSSFSLSQIERIYLGKASKTFREYGQRVDSARCFSIIFKSAQAITLPQSNSAGEFIISCLEDDDESKEQKKQGDIVDKDVDKKSGEPQKLKSYCLDLEAESEKSRQQWMNALGHAAKLARIHILQYEPRRNAMDLNSTFSNVQLNSADGFNSSRQFFFRLIHWKQQMETIDTNESIRFIPISGEKKLESSANNEERFANYVQLHDTLRQLELERITSPTLPSVSRLPTRQPSSKALPASSSAAAGVDEKSASSDSCASVDYAAVFQRLSQGARFVAFFGWLPNTGTTAQRRHSLSVGHSRVRSSSITHPAALPATAVSVQLTEDGQPFHSVARSVEVVLTYSAREEHKRSGPFGCLSWCSAETWTKEDTWYLPLTHSTKLLLGKQSRVFKDNHLAIALDPKLCATIVTENLSVNFSADSVSRLKNWLKDFLLLMQYQSWNAQIDGEQTEVEQLRQVLNKNVEETKTAGVSMSLPAGAVPSSLPSVSSTAASSSMSSS